MNLGDLATWHTRPRLETLIHELTHCWQSQHHPDRTAFMVNSVKSQALAEAENLKSKLLRLGWTADAYYYVPGGPFATYAAEQIAEQVEDTFTGKTRLAASVTSHVSSLKPYDASKPNESSLAVARVDRDSTPGVVT
jgi:hypothetical protein